MINYNYLSCTDYDGKTKEINFCSENLPESASADCTYLALHTDNNDPNILHIKKVSADDLKKELVFPSTTQIYKELNDSIITVSTNLSAALDTAVENSEKKLNAVVEQLPKLYTGILEIAGANVTPNENFGWGASTFTFSLNAQVFYGKEFFNQSPDGVSMSYSQLLDFLKNYLKVPGTAKIPLTGELRGNNTATWWNSRMLLSYNNLIIYSPSISSNAESYIVFSEDNVNSNISIKLRTWQISES